MSVAHPRVLGVLAGQDMPGETLRRWALSADVVLAADAGADRLMAVDVRPEIVIGDLDSTSLTALSGLDIRLAEDQETTDCDKLLALAAELGHGSITLASVEGDRPDHFVATLHSAAKSALDVRIAFRRSIGWVLRDGARKVLNAGVGRQVSLLPLSECRGVHFEGVAWPLADSPLEPLGQTSISNRSAADVISIVIESGVALLVVEYKEDEMPVWEPVAVP
jgi:thiamine pyrophosphokinase